jgi:hypothetical protein
MFGQPLYTKDAGLAEKAGRFTRSLVDPIVPGALTPLGVGAQKLILPENVPGTEMPINEFMPSYRWRKLSNAIEGKTSVGVTGKEPALSRSIRAGLGIVGVPVQTPVPFTYLPDDIEERLDNN